jgi:hypothetical protein
MTAAEHVIFAEQLIASYQPAGHKLKPVVAVDREGPIGWEVFGALRAANERNAFILFDVRSSQPSKRPLLYDLARTDLWVDAAEWMRRGGAIPKISQLLKDLGVPELLAKEKGEVVYVTPKKDFRELLGRSPDMADAFCLSCYEPRWLLEEGAGHKTPTGKPNLDPFEGASAMDPFAGGIDPYAGQIDPYRS